MLSVSNATFPSVYFIWETVSDIIWETVSDMKEFGLTCSPHARLTCSILLDLPLPVICIWTKFWNSFQTFVHSNFSSTFLTTDVERNKLPTGFYFFACLIFSPQSMNAFVTDFIVDSIVTCMQGFSNEILINFLLETVFEISRN